jgi:hypothetical protein
VSAGGGAEKCCFGAALVTGSLCGALAYHCINLAAIWFAAAALSLGAARSSPRPSISGIDSGGGLPDFSNGSACSRALRRDRE